jgi:Fe-S cluster assembly protein SufD
MPDAALWRRANALAVARAPELAAMAASRSAALARVLACGLPDERVENWRYTDLRPLAARAAVYLGNRPGSGSAPPSPAHVNIVNGEWVAGATDLPAGLEVTSGRRSPAFVTDESWLAAATGPLADVNAALLTDVVRLRVPTGHTIDTVVHLQIMARGPTMVHPRVLVDLGPHSRLALAVNYAGDAAALLNPVTQIRLREGAQLTLVRCQDLPLDAHLTEVTQVEVGQEASLSATTLELGGELARHELRVILQGAGAVAAIRGVFAASGTRHVELRTSLEHAAPRTRSTQQLRGLASDTGRGVLNGRIVVQPGANGADAKLSNRNLLLASGAEIDTKPELEIHADDVRCSHGATTGQLDADALFYLRTRGLDPATARHALITAFLASSVTDLPETLRAPVAALLTRHTP